jgi:tRNA A37 threonylcarbamoyladenosine modification protein TsaB
MRLLAMDTSTFVGTVGVLRDGGLLAGAGLRIPVVDAYKGEVYAAAYALDDGGALIERLAPFHAPPAEAAQRLLAAAPEGPLWLAGNGLERYPELLAAVGARARRAPRLCDVPRAACLAHEALLALQQDGPSDLARLEPLYLRPSDAKLPA